MTFLIILITSICVLMLLDRALRKQERLRKLNEETESVGENLLAAQRQERISGYRHDLANHIRTLEALSADTGEQKALKSLCMIKQEVCKAEGIGVNLHITPDGFECLAKTGTDVELVGLLSNLWDNAIEAILRVKDKIGKTILFEIRPEDHGVRIIMENPIDIVPDFRTEKEGDHGHGMRIMKETIERKNGRLDIQTTDKSCRMICFLPYEDI